MTLRLRGNDDEISDGFDFNALLPRLCCLALMGGKRLFEPAHGFAVEYMC